MTFLQVFATVACAVVLLCGSPLQAMADDQNQKDDGQKNQKDDGQYNQKDDGQKNQKDDGQQNQNDGGQKNQQGNNGINKNVLQKANQGNGLKLIKNSGQRRFQK